MSLLWHEDLGPLTVSSPLRFFPEGKNSQDDRHDMVERCLTPRIVAEEFVSTGDFAMKATGALTNDVFVYSAVGKKSVMEYRVARESLEIDASCRLKNARYVLPVVTAPSDSVMVSDHLVTIRKRDRTMEIRTSEPVERAQTDRGGGLIWSPVTGCLCTQFECPIRPEETLRIRLSVSRSSAECTHRADRSGLSCE